MSSLTDFLGFDKLWIIYYGKIIGLFWVCKSFGIGEDVWIKKL